MAKTSKDGYILLGYTKTMRAAITGRLMGYYQYEYAHLVNMMNFRVVMTFVLSNGESWLVNKIMCNDQNDEYSSHYDLQ